MVATLQFRVKALGFRAEEFRHGSSTLRVQVFNNHRFTRDPYYNCCYPHPKVCNDRVRGPLTLETIQLSLNPSQLLGTWTLTLGLHVYKYYLDWAPMSINDTYIGLFGAQGLGIDCQTFTVHVAWSFEFRESFRCIVL